MRIKGLEVGRFRVFLDDVAQRAVVEADDEAGCVVRVAADRVAGIWTPRLVDGRAVTERVTGKVRIEALAPARAAAKQEG